MPSRHSLSPSGVYVADAADDNQQASMPPRKAPMAAVDRIEQPFLSRTTVRRAELPPRHEIAAAHLTEEGRLVGGLIERAVFSADERRRTGEIARQLVHAARAGHQRFGGVDAFMREYGLSSEEGVILMCIAESLLRIPDTETADALIAEKIGEGSWDRHLGHSDSLLVNASTWGLLLSGRLVRLKEARGAGPLSVLKRLVARSGEPVIRQAIRQAVKLLGDQFVLGRTINEALDRSQPYAERGYLFSYDMLGEAARTAADADRYFARYLDAIHAIGRAAGPLLTQHPDALMRRPGVSIKLSALHPRFEAGKEARLHIELVPRLVGLAEAARAQGLTLTFDAEEQDRLDVGLEMFGQTFAHPALDGWHGLGIAVQAYGKRAIPAIRWLRRLAEPTGRRIPVRLVKGAYWDSEIKWAQERAFEDYPVFTRKIHTDVSYLAAMRLLLSDRRTFFAQFATHNAHTMAAAYVAGGGGAFELQRLHGMGEALYEDVVDEGRLGAAARIYAPVGGHDDLLPYLVRRLLENGANASFVNRLANEDAPISDMVRDPVETVEAERTAGTVREPMVRPRDLFAPDRRSGAGLPLGEASVREALLADMERALAHDITVGPVIAGELIVHGREEALLRCPHDLQARLGTAALAASADIAEAIDHAVRHRHTWDRMPVATRAGILAHAADLFERDRARLMAVIVREAGKTLTAAHDEVREAVDLLRYYAGEARRLLGGPQPLKGPTGETNVLSLHARGPIAAISPWNFPLAIFTGQVAAALVTGNPVIAKPAAQTPVTAFLATSLLIEAGVPAGVLHLLPGGAQVGAAIVRDPRIAGVVFTGSNETAWHIARALADRKGPILPFIAETAGLNAMIADSSALTEQVVRDAVRSAFDSAGQRCSAARVLFLQEDIADRTIDMLAGATLELSVGDPMDYATDVGPVIDEVAQDALDAHKLRMRRLGRLVADAILPDTCCAGTFVAPAVYEIESFAALEREEFGPILHVVRYARGHLDKVVAAINDKGYGLTLGLHSRIAGVADYVAEHARVGNLYVNRQQIGAVPGAQPFGGEGLSGSGPKAGGPNYLMRFLTERVRSTDITATGGNFALLNAVRDD
ncbi:MAG: bifunctional proline dehydrogenase/L-glutamate gamma-semialdehyde dehydrogenase PutA [Hyphomicrobiaceae bacterium]|nr:bifunctional proline dehydrogenase/L-glutamate gamma-semialdehyde dehydrogenase PutA [Hyphomicrobiaceae bacterium]